MMDMQEIKARKPHAQTLANNEHDQIDELDPSVQTTASLLSENEQRRRHGKHMKSWVQYVLDRVWSAAFFAVASFGLYEAQFVHEVLYAPEANRAYVNVGIFCVTLVVLFGCYIELYRSLMLGEKVSYATAKTSTHGMLLSMVAAGVSLTIGLWPVWHWLTLPYLFMWFWGVIVQIVVLFPVQLQRVLFAIAYLWFMHSYLSLFVV